MFKELYNRVLRMASHPKAEWALFAIAFIESSVFPIPPDVLLIPMVLVNFDKAFRFALICTIGSVFGGVLGYGIGAAFFETAGQWVINFYNMQDGFTTLQTWYKEYDVYIVGVAGFSPIPYKLFTITTGAMGGDLDKFIAASAISRGARFFLIAWLLWRGGAPFKQWIETNLYPLTMAASIVFILGIVLIKFIFAG